MSLDTPIAIVQEAEQEDLAPKFEKDAQYWDQKAVKADGDKSRNLLAQIEALHNLSEIKGFENLGFKTLAEYVFDRFGRSRAWLMQNLSIYRTFHKTLGISLDKMASIGPGKLSKLVSQVNEDNVIEVLDDAESKTQKEISDDIKAKNGLKPNETRQEDGQKTIRVKGPDTSIETIQTGIDSAKDLIFKDTEYYQSASEVSDVTALEAVCRDYVLNKDQFEHTESELDVTVRRLEEIYNVSIKVYPRGQEPVEVTHIEDIQEDLTDYIDDETISIIESDDFTEPPSEDDYLSLEGLVPEDMDVN